MLIDWFTIMAQVLNFLVLVWLLKRFLYKPILKAIDEREDKIATQVSNAKKMQEDANNQYNDLQKKNEDINNQREALLNKATKEAGVERDKLFEEARSAADAFTEKRRIDFKRQEKEIHQILVEKVQTQVFTLTRKVLSDLANIGLESQIIDIFLSRLSELDHEKKDLIKSASSISEGVIISSIDLTQKQQKQIENAIAEYLNNKIQLHFKVNTEIFSGIELVIDGYKLAWSIRDYVSSLEKEVHALLNPQMRTS